MWPSLPVIYPLDFCCVCAGLAPENAIPPKENDVIGGVAALAMRRAFYTAEWLMAVGIGRRAFNLNFETGENSVALDGVHDG
jgi:hypothetical protein